jgi:transcriptional regulator with XRE-family HTH domain
VETLEEIFKKNLVRLRRGRTQAEVAELAGIPERSYQNAKLNGVIPQAKNRMAIAKAFGVDELDLFVDPDRYVKNTGISALQALEVLTEFVEKNVARSTAPKSKDSKELELIAVAGGRPDLLSHLIDIARTFVSTGSGHKVKSRRA